MGCGDRPPCGSRGGGPVSRPFARASASVRKRKVFIMRKFKSKKGFTLAELLVVVAIIAVLSAIAIPVFSTQLNSTKLAADHAMIREAYALMQYAKITEEITFDGTTMSIAECHANHKYIFYLSKDGSLIQNSDNAYQLQASEEDCSQLPVVEIAGFPSVRHQKDAYIVIWIHESGGTLQMDMIGLPSW